MTDIRPIFIKHMLALVPFDGWSDHSILQAGKNAGLSPQEIKNAFPGGPADYINYFFACEDEALAERFTAEALAAMRVPSRIEALILARLSHLAPHREAVRRGIAFYALPWNAAHGCRALYRTMDMIWKLAGDQSLDFSFYTKRATLTAIYTSTVLFWLNDDSEKHMETKEFLKRRLAGVAAFGKMKKDIMNKMKRA